MASFHRLGWHHVKGQIVRFLESRWALVGLSRQGHEIRYTHPPLVDADVHLELIWTQVDSGDPHPIWESHLRAYGENLSSESPESLTPPDGDWSNDQAPVLDRRPNLDKAPVRPTGVPYEHPPRVRDLEPRGRHEVCEHCAQRIAVHHQ